MADLIITIQHKNADGKTSYFSTTAEDVDPKTWLEDVSEAAEVLRDEGFCSELEKGHYVFVPAHAVYRADFELIEEPKK